MPLSFNVDKFVKQTEQAVVNKVGGVIQGKIMSLESKAGVFGDIARVAGLGGFTDDIFKKITSSASSTDNFSSSRYAKLFGKKDKQPTSKPAAAVVAESKGSEGSALRYPSDLGEFATVLQFAEYQRPVPLKAPTVNNTQTIYLPLPQQLNDAYSVGYTPTPLGFVGTLADAAMAASEGDADGGAAAAGGVQVGRAAISGLGKASAAAGAAAARAAEVAGTRAIAKPALGKLGAFVAGSALSSEVAAYASQTTGTQLNPNLSVTFDGPRLRQFGLSWEFVPHNAKESATIKKIINEIKKRMLPVSTFEGSTAVLSYPEMVQIKMQPETVNVFKRAMIEAVNVNYAANGIPTFFKGTKEPMFISLQISFIELEYFLSSDFGGDKFDKGVKKDIVDVASGIVTGSATLIGDAITSALPGSGNPQGG